MNCKHCKQPVMVSIKGLGNFCSWECRKKHRSEQTVNRHNNHDVTVTSENKAVEELGGQKWYDLAKRLCVNFDMRVKEGFCSFLFDPTKIHQKQCSRCELGQGLMRFDNNRKLVKRHPARASV